MGFGTSKIMAKVSKAIILVAGYGTRFLPITKAIPKEMLPVVDVPQVQFLVEEVVASGIRDIIFVTSRAKQALENYFDESPELVAFLRKKKKISDVKRIQRLSRLARFAYIRQPRPIGHGDAVLRAAKFFARNESVAVLFGDDIVVSKEPALAQLLNAFAHYQDSVIALSRVPRDRISLYGAVKARILPPSSSRSRKIQRVYQVEKFVEKPKPDHAPSNLAVLGKYILTPEFFSTLRNLKRGGLELGVGDAFNAHIARHPLYGVEIEGVWHDVGSKLGFLQAQVEFGLLHQETGKPFARWLRTVKPKRR